MTFKNTPNLINLSLFQKHKNEVKTVNWQKLKNKKPTNVYKTKPCSIKLPTTSSTQPKLPHVPIKKLPQVPILKKKKKTKLSKKKKRASLHAQSASDETSYYYYYYY